MTNQRKYLSSNKFTFSNIQNMSQVLSFPSQELQKLQKPQESQGLQEAQGPQEVVSRVNNIVHFDNGKKIIADFLESKWLLDNWLIISWFHFEIANMRDFPYSYQINIWKGIVIIDWYEFKMK